MQDFSSPLAQPFDFPEGNHGVLLIHGFTGSPAHMRLLGEGLHERGYAVRGMLLPGHAARPEDMRRTGWQDWLLAARTAAREMQARYARFSVAGLSMGGVLSLLLAQEMEITACVSIAAPMKTTNKLRCLALPLSPFVPMLGWRDEAGPRKGMDARYDIGYSNYPTISVHHLNVLMKKARQHLSLIHCPLLAVQSRKDETVTPDSPEIILSGVSSRVRASLWLDEAPHVCTISPEYPKIVSAMDEFLRAAESGAQP